MNTNEELKKITKEEPNAIKEILLQFLLPISVLKPV